MAPPRAAHSSTLLFMVLCLGSALAARQLRGQDDAGPKAVDGEFIIKWKPEVDDARKEQALKVAGAKKVEKLRDDTDVEGRGKSELALLRANGNIKGDDVKGKLEKMLDAVEYIEPNWLYTHQAVSDDSYVTSGQLWGMGAGGNAFGIGATAAWGAGKTDCGNVYVGIIDEGVMITHPDLAANIGTTNDIPNNGIDDDGNGFVDDVNGWDFVSNDKSVYDGTSDDHGTHVAGTIGAVGGNGQGVAGVCWGVKILAAKFLGTSSGTTANAIKAVDYFTDLKLNRGIDIVATSNSWGGSGYSQGLFDAIQRANNAGILFVAAAGNSNYNTDTTANYPSNYDLPNIISVAAITSTGSRASFSNYGARTVDIGAPGNDIWSTVPPSVVCLQSTCRGRNKCTCTQTGLGSYYASYSGTSMATPHVTGAVALYKARNPTATAAQIKAGLLNAGVVTSSLSGITVTGKRVNVASF